MKHIDALISMSRHVRSDCNDGNLSNVVTCIRCSLLHYKKEGKWDNNYILEMFLRKNC